jgi:hypothetical protein
MVLENRRKLNGSAGPPIGVNSLAMTRQLWPLTLI